MVLLPDELDIIVDGLLADVRKVRIMFPQVVANAAAGNGGKTGKEGCDGLLVGMEFVISLQHDRHQYHEPFLHVPALVQENEVFR